MLLMKKNQEERVKENDMSNNNVEYQDKRNSQIIEDNNEINDINNQNNQNNNGEQNAKEQAV